MGRRCRPAGPACRDRPVIPVIGGRDDTVADLTLTGPAMAQLRRYVPARYGRPYSRTAGRRSDNPPPDVAGPSPSCGRPTSWTTGTPADNRSHRSELADEPARTAAAETDTANRRRISPPGTRPSGRPDNFYVENRRYAIEIRGFKKTGKKWQAPPLARRNARKLTAAGNRPSDRPEFLC